MKNRPKECIYTCALKRHMVIGEFVLVGAMIKKAKLTPSFTIIMTKHEYHRFSKKRLHWDKHTHLSSISPWNKWSLDPLCRKFLTSQYSFITAFFIINIYINIDPCRYNNYVSKLTFGKQWAWTNTCQIIYI